MTSPMPTTNVVPAADATATTAALDDGRPHDNLISTFNASIWVLTGVSGVFFMARAYCKITRQRGLWWDDYVMGAAWITLIISSIFGSISTTMGFGRHSWDMDMTSPNHPKLLFIMNMTGFWSIWGAAWSKTSFAITLLRLATERVRWLIWFIIVTVNLGLTLAAIFMWTQCDPPRKVWHTNMDGTCWDPAIIVGYNSWASVWSGLADMALAIVPWWVISRHSINYKERIGLLVCMSLGVFAGITSIAKTITLRAITSNDMIHTVPLNILGIAEAAVTIVAASIPVLRALLTTPNASKARSKSGYLDDTGHNTTGSKTGRDYECLDKDVDQIKLTILR